MIKVPAEEFQRDFGKFQDLALTQPVTVTREGRDSAVLISCEEYLQLKRRARRVIRLEDFTEAEIEAIAKSKAPAEAAAFDHEVGR